MNVVFDISAVIGLAALILISTIFFDHGQHVFGCIIGVLSALSAFNVIHKGIPAYKESDE